MEHCELGGDFTQYSVFSKVFSIGNVTKREEVLKTLSLDEDSIVKRIKIDYN